MEEKKDEELRVDETSANEPDLAYKNGKERVKSGILGFFIGLAIIVPGVSGCDNFQTVRKTSVRAR